MQVSCSVLFTFDKVSPILDQSMLKKTFIQNQTHWRQAELRVLIKRMTHSTRAIVLSKTAAKQRVGALLASKNLLDTLA